MNGRTTHSLLFQVENRKKSLVFEFMMQVKSDNCAFVSQLKCSAHNMTPQQAFFILCLF